MCRIAILNCSYAVQGPDTRTVRRTHDGPLITETSLQAIKDSDMHWKIFGLRADKYVVDLDRVIVLLLKEGIEILLGMHYK